MDHEKNTLPHALGRAHDKVFEIMIFYLFGVLKGGKYFVVRREKDARRTHELAMHFFGTQQTSSLSCARNKVHGKGFGPQQRSMDFQVSL
jgi:hypothetical protein